MQATRHWQGKVEHWSTPGTAVHFWVRCPKLWRACLELPLSQPDGRLLTPAIYCTDRSGVTRRGRGGVSWNFLVEMPTQGLNRFDIRGGSIVLNGGRFKVPGWGGAVSGAGAKA